MYEAPTQRVFQEMKDIAISIWIKYDNQYGYVDEKLERIKDITNLQDNGMSFYRMFDWSNQALFLGRCSDDARSYIMKNI